MITEEMIVNEAVNFIKEYGNGKEGQMNKSQKVQFLIELEEFIDRYTIGGEKELLPYCGTVTIEGNEVRSYLLIDSISNGDTYQYLSNTLLGKLLNDPKFQEAIRIKVGRQEAANFLWGLNDSASKYAIEGENILCIADFISQKAMAESASGNVKPMIFEVKDSKVFFRTEFDALLKSDKVTQLWGVDKSLIIDMVNSPKNYGFESANDVKLTFGRYFLERTKEFTGKNRCGI